MTRAALSRTFLAIVMFGPLLASCDDDNPRDGTRRFCSGVASVERSLQRVAALDSRSSAANAQRAHEDVQDAYHDFVDGHTALQIFGPRTIDIDDISRDIEDLLEVLRETADGEPIASQIADIESLSADVTAGTAAMNEEADC